MLFEERVQNRFAELVVRARATVPAKPSTGDTMIVEVPAELAFTVTLTGLAMMLKPEGGGSMW